MRDQTSLEGTTRRRALIGLHFQAGVGSVDVMRREAQPWGLAQERGRGCSRWLGDGIQLTLVMAERAPPSVRPGRDSLLIDEDRLADFA